MVYLNSTLALGSLCVPPTCGSFSTRTAPTLLGVGWDQWAALNAFVGGHLQLSKPFELPCFSSFEGQPISLDPKTCAAVQANYSDPVSRSKRFGAYMVVSTVALSHCLDVNRTCTSPCGRHARPQVLAAF